MSFSVSSVFSCSKTIGCGSAALGPFVVKISLEFCRDEQVDCRTPASPNPTGASLLYSSIPGAGSVSRRVVRIPNRE